MVQKLKIGVMISGRGSNLQALINACKSPDFPADIALVFSNKSDAYGLNRAKDAGIETRSFSVKEFATKCEYEQQIDTAMRDHGVDLICLAGYMRILGDDFVAKWKDRMINIHPSLLPAYKGLHTHKRALDEGCRFTGCTVHFVVPALDSGPIILQAAVPIGPNDTADSLAEKVLPYEHQLYPAAVRLFAEGKITVSDFGKVNISDQKEPKAGLFNPLITV